MIIKEEEHIDNDDDDKCKNFQVRMINEVNYKWKKIQI